VIESRSTIVNEKSQQERSTQGRSREERGTVQQYQSNDVVMQPQGEISKNANVTSASPPGIYRPR